MLELKEIQKDHIQDVKKALFANMSVLLNQFPEVLRDFLRTNGIITGGAIPSLMHNETPTDYDLYLEKTEDILSFKQYVSNMDKNLIQDANEKYVEVLVEGKLVTANATTFINNIQVITMHTADARSTFDFVHCMPWYKIATNTLYISKKQYNAVLNKHLIKNEHKNAFALSHKRIEKYNSRGWRFP